MIFIRFLHKNITLKVRLTAHDCVCVQSHVASSLSQKCFLEPNNVAMEVLLLYFWKPMIIFSSSLISFIYFLDE